MRRLTLAGWKHRWTCVWVVVGAFSASLVAQTTAPSPAEQPAPRQLEGYTPLPASPEESGALLGESWESPVAGISFKRLAGSKEIPHAAADALLAEFVSPDKTWVLKVAQTKTDRPLALTVYRDQWGIEQKGLKELTLEQTKRTNPGAEVLRDDVITIGEADVGMIAVRYVEGTQRKLTQLALIKKSEMLYYVFNLTTPGSSARLDKAATTEPAEEEDPNERRAVETFSQLLDSVKFLDRGAIRDNQNQRLFETRLLFGNWTASRVQKALVGEQWLRMIRDGKDIGYTYVIEKSEQRGNTDGVLIGVGSHTREPNKPAMDMESWMYSNIDRQHESWTNVARSLDDKGEGNYVSEVGATDKLLESYPLTVKTKAKSGNADPVQRELPPFYLPQAMCHMLPRLLPLHDQREYMFACYVGGQREVMARYVEVLREQEVTFNGRKIRAIPIHDRIGWDGPVTNHYMSPEGVYLGSESILRQPAAEGQAANDVHMVLLPSDADTLIKLWGSPNLTAPPRQPDEPQPLPRKKLPSVDNYRTSPADRPGSPKSPTSPPRPLR